MSEARDVQALIAEARAGRWRPVVALVGSERFLAERALALLRKAVLGEGPRGFNDDVFHGAQLAAGRILAAARTLPMMAPARFVLVRDVDAAAPEQLDALAPYVASPSPSTCLVLVAEKLDGRTALARACKAAGAWVDCEPLKAAMLERFIAGEARRRGHPIDEAAVEALVEALGNDLAAIDDAIERLCLFVGRLPDGRGAAIDAKAVEQSVSRLRVDSVWNMVGAVAARRADRALAALLPMLAEQPRQEPRLLGLVAREIRIVARAKKALAEGLRGPALAKAAGAPPFKARELEAAARQFDDAMLHEAIRILAEAGIALKGSKRPAPLVMQEAILALCHGRELPLVSLWQLRA